MRLAHYLAASTKMVSALMLPSVTLVPLKARERDLNTSFRSLQFSSNSHIYSGHILNEPKYLLDNSSSMSSDRSHFFWQDICCGTNVTFGKNYAQFVFWFYRKWRTLVLKCQYWQDSRFADV